MNRRLHHVLPSELGIEPVTLLDFPVQRLETADARKCDQDELASILDASACDVAVSLCTAFSRFDAPLAQMLATSVTPRGLVIWKGEGWIECDFTDRSSPDRNGMLLLKFPLKDPLHVPSDWPAEEQLLMQFLSGFREDYPPSGGAFWDGRSPATLFQLGDSEQFPQDAVPGQLIFTARNGNLIVREDDGRYVWWRNACSERIPVAGHAAEFESVLIRHFANDWVNWKGTDVLWPFDGCGREQRG